MYVSNKMKKITVIFFALLYLVSTAGVAWSNFYCCGKLKEVYFFSSKNSSKDCKGNKRSGCCDTKSFSFKVKDNHSPSAQVKVNGADVKLFNYPVSSVNLPCIAYKTYSFALAHAPPLISKQPVYISVCNFRI